jgi:vacuolar protein sorting-associated protein 35
MSADQEQDRWKHDAMQMVKQQAYHMKRALEVDNLRDALKHSANMISELRTSLLSPRNYYELYMTVTDELRYLEAHFADEQRGSRRSMLELYELVQHAGNILPRLYLLITVGGVYIKSKQAPAKDILRDLVEMCRGVQHPLRGLFLRNYLSQTSKDKLPDTGSDYEGAGGSVDDAIAFVLSNFGEMNRLWVRIQHQGPARERERREAERQELRILVGTSLVRLSQLEGIDLPKYADAVLPRVLEQIVGCKDALAQHYLMECVVNVFPDEYHLATLEALLAACSELQPGVDVKAILVALMARLAAHAAAARAGTAPAGAGAADEAAAFAQLLKYVTELAASASAVLGLADTLVLLHALLDFALKAFPTRTEYAQLVFAAAAEPLAAAPRALDAASARALVQLLVAPLEAYRDVHALLALPAFAPRLAALPYPSQKAVCADLARASVNFAAGGIADADVADRLLGALAPLVRGEAEAAGGLAGEHTPVDDDDDDLHDDLALVCAVVGQLRAAAAEPRAQLRLLEVARARLRVGGPQRLRRTLVPVVLRALELAAAVHAAAGGAADGAETVSVESALAFARETLAELPPEGAAVSVRLNLSAALAADACGLEAAAFDFVSQALIVYEEELPDSRAQAAAIADAVGALHRMTYATARGRAREGKRSCGGGAGRAGGRASARCSPADIGRIARRTRPRARADAIVRAPHAQPPHARAASRAASRRLVAQRLLGRELRDALREGDAVLRQAFKKTRPVPRARESCPSLLGGGAGEGRRVRRAWHGRDGRRGRRASRCGRGRRGRDAAAAAAAARRAGRATRAARRQASPGGSATSSQGGGRLQGARARACGAISGLRASLPHDYQGSGPARVRSRARARLRTSAAPSSSPPPLTPRRCRAGCERRARASAARAGQRAPLLLRAPRRGHRDDARARRRRARGRGAAACCRARDRARRRRRRNAAAPRRDARARARAQGRARGRRRRGGRRALRRAERRGDAIVRNRESRRAGRGACHLVTPRKLRAFGIDQRALVNLGSVTS